VPKQVVSVPFSAGLDEKTAPEYVQPGSFTSLVNCVLRKGGVIGKRYGYTALSNGIVSFGTMPASVKLFGAPVSSAGAGDYVNELLATDGDWLYGYSLADGKWKQKDQLGECSATWSPIAQSTIAFDNPDIAFANKYVVYAFLADLLFTGNVGIYYVVLDAESGMTIMAPTLIASLPAATDVKGLRLLTTPGDQCVVCVFKVGSTASSIYASRMPLGSVNPGFLFSTPTVLTTDAVDGGGQTFDAQGIPGTSSFIVVFENTSGTTKLSSLIATSTFGTISEVQLNESSAAFEAVTVAPQSSSLIFLAYSDSSHHVRVATVSSANSILSQPATSFTTSDANFVLSSAAVNGTTVFLCCSNQQNPAICNRVSMQQWTTGSGNLGPTRKTNNVYLWSRPFLQNNRMYSLVCYQFGSDGLQNTQFLVDYSIDDVQNAAHFLRPVATITPRSCITKPSGQLTQTVAASPTRIPANTVLNTDGFSPQYGMQLAVGTQMKSALVFGNQGLLGIALNFSASQNWNTAILGDSLYLSGGVPSVYDGQFVTEVGFLVFPSINPTVTLGGLNSGQLNPTGAASPFIYQYRVTYEWWDAQGNLHRSAASPAISVDAGGVAHQSATLNISALTLTNKIELITTPDVGKTVNVNVYRTIGNGSTFYMLSSTSVSPNDIANGNGVNVFIDSSAASTDAAIVGNAQLYDQTDGNGVSIVVDNVCPPSMTYLCSHKNRLWGVAGDQRTIWYTKSATPNEAPAFADEFTVAIMEGGPVLALASMDDKLVIFQSDRISFLSGDGALDTGQSSSLDGPVRIPSDVGMLDPRGMIVTPVGIFFQSQIGVYLLTRSYVVQYIGRAVEAEVSADQPLTSAAYDPDASEVRWTTQQGPLLVYNYLFNAWSVFNFHDQTQGFTSPDPVVSCTSVDGSFYLCLPNGHVYQETPGSFFDAATYVPMSLETPWIKMNAPSGGGGIGGTFRLGNIRVLADKNDAHNLSMSFAFDNDPAYVQTNTWLSQVFAAQTEEVAQMHAGAAYSKCSSVRVKLADAPGTSPVVSVTGQGPTFIALDLEVRLREGLHKRIAAAQRA
jgi:hypothetical protein